jgi:hypothetical protein
VLDVIRRAAGREPPLAEEKAITRQEG